MKFVDLETAEMQKYQRTRLTIIIYGSSAEIAMQKDGTSVKSMRTLKGCSKIDYICIYSFLIPDMLLN